jgi:CobQ-like glutamine amidotransferase family enzyme
MEDLGAPISYLVLKRGAIVYSSDGERLGRVVRVSGDRKSHIFDGIVFDTTVGPGGHRFVDAPEVADIYEHGVILTITAAAAESLPKKRVWDTLTGH